MRSILLISFLLFGSIAFAQTSSHKFGKVTVEELQKRQYDIDPTADAVVLFNKGSAELEGNTKGWFTVVYKRHSRIHILNKNGYDEATISVQVFESLKDEVSLSNFKATTYNLVDGKVVQSKLNKKEVMTERIDDQYSFKKFTLPQVSEGSIIEFEYTLKSDFIHRVMPWYFQSGNPTLYSEYKFTVPAFFNYAAINSGYHPFTVNEREQKKGYFSITDQTKAGMFSKEGTERTNINTEVAHYRWAMSNVPGLKVESFTSSLKNHLSKLEFQLSALREPFVERDVMGNWPQLSKALNEHEYFGMYLTRNNGWLDDVVSGLTMGVADKEVKARNIYAYVRDNYTATGESGVFMDKKLREVFRSKSGTPNEINLLLTAMLKYAKLDAQPVILSTRDHGYVYSNYPILDRFNYVVALVHTGKESVFLDASRPRLGFGRLLPECYNGQARVIDEWGSNYELLSDNLKEVDNIQVRMLTDESGKWIAVKETKSGDYGSYIIREKLIAKGEENFKKEVQGNLGDQFQLTAISFNKLKDYDEPVTTTYTVEVKTDGADILYINPMMGEGYKTNPFKSEKRLYPIEMLFANDETYNLTMQIPEGYEIDEMPKPTKVTLNTDGDAVFEYLIEESLNTITMRSHLQFKKAYYSAEQYDGLRSFFKMVVDKHAEPVVLKKKKS